MVYTAFITDVYSRRIVGWRTATTMTTDTAIRYTDRLVEAGVTCSVGTVGDSSDNALAESVNGLYKTELVRKRGPWKTIDDLEIATLEWVDWYNHRRLHTVNGNLPPAEYKTLYNQQTHDKVPEMISN
jgi:putative transposase